MGQRLGQHFLKNPVIAKALVDACQIRERESIVEIGPGAGALTTLLLATRSPVIAIEKDEALVAQLQKTFAGAISSSQLRIIEGDVRNILPESLGLESKKYALAANIPYYITGEILRMYLSASAQPRVAALLVQKEVAKRIVAKKESILSLSVKVYGSPRIARHVSAGNFSPPPEVDSAILVIDDISRRNFETKDQELAFFKIVKAGFSSKRKLLLNNLAEFDKASVAASFEKLGIPAMARAEDLPLEKWLELTKILFNVPGSGN